MAIFPSPQAQAQAQPPVIIENNDEIAITIYRGNLSVDIAYQKQEKTLEIAAYDLESGDAAPLPVPLIISPEELDQIYTLRKTIIAYKAA